MRVSDGFKRPSRRENMLSEHGRIWPQPGNQMVRFPTYVFATRFLPPTCITHKLNVKMDFLTPLSLLTPPFFPLFLRTRSLDRLNSLSRLRPLLSPLVVPSRTLITHLDAGRRRRKNEGEIRRRSTYVSKSLCASCGERRCVAVVRERFSSLVRSFGY